MSAVIFCIFGFSYAPRPPAWSATWPHGYGNPKVQTSSRFANPRYDIMYGNDPSVTPFCTHSAIVSYYVCKFGQTQNSQQPPVISFTRSIFTCGSAGIEVVKVYLIVNPVLNDPHICSIN